MRERNKIKGKIQGCRSGGYLLLGAQVVIVLLVHANQCVHGVRRCVAVQRAPSNQGVGGLMFFVRLLCGLSPTAGRLSRSTRDQSSYVKRSVGC